MGSFARLGNELYNGRRSVDFVGRKWLWYTVSLVIVAVAIIGLAVRGLNYGIEFTGGTQITVSLDASEVTQDTADELREAVADAGIESAGSPIVTTSGDTAVVVQTEELTAGEAAEISTVIIDTVGVGPDDLSAEKIGASWGEEVAERALIGLLVFLVLVVLFIWAYFRQWKMSVAALVALAHDIIITVGVFALDPVRGDAGDGHRSADDPRLLALRHRGRLRQGAREHQGPPGDQETYAQAANLALNQTLVRSINTSIVALIPIASILYVGAFQLGASSLKDLALALFVGTAAGIYSSVFIATPLLVHLKSRESEVVLAEKRAKARARRRGRPVRVGAVVLRGDAGLQRGRQRPARRGRGRRRRRGRRRDRGPGRAEPRHPRRSAAAGPSRRPRDRWATARRPDGSSRAGSRSPSAARSSHGGTDVTGAREVLERLVLDVPDFPEPGIVFKDITPLLADHAAFTTVVQALADAGRDESGATVVDKVVGMEARGFILAAPVALALGAGLRPRPQGGQAAPRDARGVLRPGVRRGDARAAPGRRGAGRAGAARRRRAGHRRHRRGHARAGRALRRRRRSASRC